MANILEFPQSQIFKNKNEIELNIKSDKVLRVVERVIEVSRNGKLVSDENSITDLDALGDIFSSFSVAESKTIALLSEAQEAGRIRKEDKLLLFAIHVSCNENGAKDIIPGILQDGIKDKNLNEFSASIKEYLLRLFQEDKK